MFHWNKLQKQWKVNSKDVIINKEILLIEGKWRKNRDEYISADLFYDGGGDSEFCQGGGAVKHYPAGGDPPDPESGGGTGGEAV